MTQVDWKRPLALAVALFVLGTFAYWLEYKQKPKKEAAEEQAKKLFNLKETPVESITIVGGGNRNFELKCSDFAAKLCKPGDNSKWELVAPLKVKADDSNVNSFLSTLTNINSADTIDLKEETPESRLALLKDYGLDPQALNAANGPVKRVLVKAANGETVLYLGAAHPVDNFFGLRATGGKVDEDQVYLVPTYFKSNFEKNLTYWRDKKLLTIGGHEVQSFQLKSAKANLKLERRNGEWIIRDRNGEEFTGDLENIDSLLSSATFLSAKEFVSDSRTDKKARTTLRQAKQVLTLILQKDKGGAKDPAPPVTLTLYRKSKPDRLYATVSTLDPLFELETAVQGRLEKELKDLRLVKLLTSMDRFNAKRLEISGKPFGEPMVLTNADSKWTAVDKTPVETEKVQQMLDKLSGNRIKEFLQRSAIPKGEQDGVRIAIGDDKTNTKRQLLFWKKGEKLYARDLNSSRKEAFLVDSAIQDGLPWDRSFFKKSEPAPSSTP